MDQDILVRKLPLSKGKFALVDSEDFDYLNQWKWSLGGDGYALRVTWPQKKTIYLHKLVNKTSKGFLTDHINRNKLDNRKSNLRTVNFYQSNRNIGLRKDNISGITGVNYRKKAQKWEVSITINGKKTYLGRYSNFQGAFLARRWAERAYYGS